MGGRAYSSALKLNALWTHCFDLTVNNIHGMLLGNWSFLVFLFFSWEISCILDMLYRTYRATTSSTSTTAEHQYMGQLVMF